MPKIKFLASMNVEAALLAPEKLLLLPPGRERKSKLIFFYSYIVGPATGGSDASHCSFTSKAGIAYDMAFQAALVKLHAAEGLMLLGYRI